MSDALIKLYRERVERALELQLPEARILPSRLHEAMRYSVLGGGKRVRPVLVYCAGQAVGLSAERLDGPAVAVELIHAYSLVHDDLPAMDDDDLRRGRATCHKAFDEATAILVGDALQALAFRVLAGDRTMSADPAVRIRLIGTLATAAGSRGMVGGQAIDLAAVGKELNLAELEIMHIHKTGALIRASILLGALSHPELDPRELEQLDHYAKCIGLAFQIRDDILDVIGDTRTLGKRQGSDQASNKPTYVSVLGLEGARSQARALHEGALRSLDSFGERAAALRWISSFIVDRVT